MVARASYIKAWKNYRLPGMYTQILSVPGMYTQILSVPGMYTQILSVPAGRLK